MIQNRCWSHLVWPRSSFLAGEPLKSAVLVIKQWLICSWLRWEFHTDLGFRVKCTWWVLVESFTDVTVTDLCERFIRRKMHRGEARRNVICERQVEFCSVLALMGCSSKNQWWRLAHMEVSQAVLSGVYWPIYEILSFLLHCKKTP